MISIHIQTITYTCAFGQFSLKMNMYSTLILNFRRSLNGLSYVHPKVLKPLDEDGCLAERALIVI